MSTHNVHFHDKIRNFFKISLNIRFLEVSEPFPRDPKTSSNQPRQTSHLCSSQLGDNCIQICHLGR